MERAGCFLPKGLTLRGWLDRGAFFRLRIDKKEGGREEEMVAEVGPCSVNASPPAGFDAPAAVAQVEQLVLCLGTSTGPVLHKAFGAEVGGLRRELIEGGTIPVSAALAKVPTMRYHRVQGAIAAERPEFSGEFLPPWCAAPDRRDLLEPA